MTTPAPKADPPSLQQQIDELKRDRVADRRIIRTMAADIAALHRTMLDAGLEPPQPSFAADKLSVKQYAERYRIKEPAVYARLRRKKLDATKEPGLGWVIKV